MAPRPISSLTQFIKPRLNICPGQYSLAKFDLFTRLFLLFIVVFLCVEQTRVTDIFIQGRRRIYYPDSSFSAM